ncbi:MAG: hypothetical protein A4E62_02602 [Syntrophorhabdus sp. PtaU1.Bin002]|nr:MAG: hypothetical protein A4E58_00875 [Syntrophorhabdus sp. PtaB.Bin006]OPY65818.1 MAG: hypothetical protein A4E62_02602 [Syntrophorhabdus sp. PtaU1.Bin002]
MSFMKQALTVSRGRSFPLGAIICPKGVHFSVFSKQSDAIELLFLIAWTIPGRPARSSWIARPIAPI